MSYAVRTGGGGGRTCCGKFAKFGDLFGNLKISSNTSQRLLQIGEGCKLCELSEQFRRLARCCEAARNVQNSRKLSKSLPRRFLPVQSVHPMNILERSLCPKACCANVLLVPRLLHGSCLDVRGPDARTVAYTCAYTCVCVCTTILSKPFFSPTCFHAFGMKPVH